MTWVFHSAWGNGANISRDLWQPVMKAANAKLSNDESLRKGIRAIAPAFVTAIIFSFFINLLVFVPALYMLQIYDRVLGTRNLVTLGGITVIAAFLLMVWAALETLRSRLLVRAGLLFDERFAAPMFRMVHRGLLRQPNMFNQQYLRDVDVIREFLTGAGLIAFCDLPWFPVYVGVSLPTASVVRLYRCWGRGRHSASRAAQRGHDSQEAARSVEGEYDRRKQCAGGLSKHRSCPRNGNARGFGGTLEQASSRGVGAPSPSER